LSPSGKEITPLKKGGNKGSGLAALPVSFEHPLFFGNFDKACAIFFRGDIFMKSGVVGVVEALLKRLGVSLVV
jgi:hypothetical protein